MVGAVVGCEDLKRADVHLLDVDPVAAHDGDRDDVAIIARRFDVAHFAAVLGLPRAWQLALEEHDRLHHAELADTPGWKP